MGQSDLTTAKYFEQAERERAEASEAAAAAELEQASLPQKGPTDAWARAYSYLSIGLAIAAIGCVMALAVPFFTGASLGHRKNPIDWLLWFGGARSDQTFEKYLRDSAETNRREWDNRYREPPAFQLESTQFNLQSLNPQSMGWHPEPSPRPRSK